MKLAGEGGVLTETLGTELATLYDPRAVTQEEAQQAFEELGFFDARPTDVQRLVGQYDESELAGRTQDQLPVATYNALVYSQEQQAAKQAAEASCVSLPPRTAGGEASCGASCF